mgnify:CR=1 FL=1
MEYTKVNQVVKSDLLVIGGAWQFFKLREEIWACLKEEQATIG